ncbi:MAG: hypothetical protein ACPHCN_16745 [Mycobacterium sp.]
MPRKSRTTHADYGKNEQLSDASAAVEDASGPAVGAGGPGGAPVPQAPPPNSVPDELIAAAQAGPSPAPGGLKRPTEMPGEPLTAGAPIGRGPGPDRAMMPARRSQITRTYESLAASTGDPFYARMAARSRR